MDDMSSTLIPVLVALAFWTGFFLRLNRGWRAFLMLPFSLGACLLLFWRIPMKPEFEPYLDAVSLVAAASIIVMSILVMRRRYRGDDTV